MSKNRSLTILFLSNLSSGFRALKIPVSDYTYDDCRIISKAHQLHIPHASTIIEAHKLRNKLGLVLEY